MAYTPYPIQTTSLPMKNTAKGRRSLGCFGVWGLPFLVNVSFSANGDDAKQPHTPANEQSILSNTCAFESHDNIEFFSPYENITHRSPQPFMFIIIWSSSWKTPSQPTERSWFMFKRRGKKRKIRCNQLAILNHDTCELIFVNYWLNDTSRSDAIVFDRRVLTVQNNVGT